jgi:hypothetical protein
MKIKFRGKKLLSEQKEEVTSEDKLSALLRIFKAYDAATKQRHLKPVSDGYTEDYDFEYREAVKELNKKYERHFDFNDLNDFLEELREKDEIDHDMYEKLRDLFTRMIYDSESSDVKATEHQDDDEVKRHRYYFPKPELVKESKR